jgi:hypothetical protein
LKSRIRLSALLIAVALAVVGGPATVFAQNHTCDHTNMIEASVDIRPFVSQNIIVVNGRGLVPVALFGSANLNVRDVDLDTVGLHPKGRCDEAVPPVTQVFSDINRDGLKDVVFVFKTQDLMLTPADTEACLHGNLLDGTHFCGHDSVVVKAGR